MHFYLLIITFLLFTGQAKADPWGKDADLCANRIESPSMPHKATLAACLIGFHQNVISKADGPRSHFYPSSSQYTLDAMKKYGFLRGYLLGCDRLMRENSEPWLYTKVIAPDGRLLKFDPVR